MSTSIFLPPSVFYTQLLPNLKTLEQVVLLEFALLDLESFVVDMCSFFRYDSPKGFVNTSYYRMLSQEKINIWMYLEALEERRVLLKRELEGE